ncbi:hypothetical protein BESB_003740 [Besnoitia besnoiti]|uniref:Uncharacterized protein n=1 Tax=Besnoitia besnoiti TaxID=94643 RepID=A0A2A9MPM7_BESBE|nr:hypothetical protein BESB_003740 [Besnoitia besnoiti]PFH38033.1 hypothetical protein BESB_003740 [Besnoitia besnoiti]
MASDLRPPAASTSPTPLCSGENRCMQRAPFASSSNRSPPLLACVVAPDGRVAGIYRGGSVLLLHRNPQCCTSFPASSSPQFETQPGESEKGNSRPRRHPSAPSHFLCRCIKDGALRDQVHHLLVVRNTFLSAVTASPFTRSAGSRCHDLLLHDAFATGPGSTSAPGRSAGLSDSGSFGRASASAGEGFLSSAACSGQPRSGSPSSLRVSATPQFGRTDCSFLPPRATSPSDAAAAPPRRAFCLTQFSAGRWPAFAPEAWRCLCTLLRASLGALLKATSAAFAERPAHLSRIAEDVSEFLAGTRVRLHDVEALLTPFQSSGGVSNDRRQNVRVWAVGLVKAGRSSQPDSEALSKSKESFLSSLDTYSSLMHSSSGSSFSYQRERGPSKSHCVLPRSPMTPYLELDATAQFVFTRWPACFSECRELVPVDSLCSVEGGTARPCPRSHRRSGGAEDAADAEVGQAGAEGWRATGDLVTPGQSCMSSSASEQLTKTVFAGGSAGKWEVGERASTHLHSREPGLTLAYAYDIQEQMLSLETAAHEAAWVPAVRLAVATHVARRLQEWLEDVEWESSGSGGKASSSGSRRPPQAPSPHHVAEQSQFMGNSWSGDTQSTSLPPCHAAGRAARHHRACSDATEDPRADAPGDRRQQFLRRSTRRACQVARLLGLLEGLEQSSPGVAELPSNVLPADDQMTATRRSDWHFQEDSTRKKTVETSDSLPFLRARLQQSPVAGMSFDVAPLPSVLPMPRSSSDLGGWSDGPPVPLDRLRRLPCLLHSAEDPAAVYSDLGAEISQSLPPSHAWSREPGGGDGTRSRECARDDQQGLLSQDYGGHGSVVASASRRHSPDSQTPFYAAQQTANRDTDGTAFGGPSSTAQEPVNMPSSLICVIPSVGVIRLGPARLDSLSTRCLCFPLPSAGEDSPSVALARNVRKGDSTPPNFTSLASRLRTSGQSWSPSKACTLSDFQACLQSPSSSLFANSQSAPFAAEGQTSSICWCLSGPRSRESRPTVSLQWLPRDQHQRCRRDLLSVAELLMHSQLEWMQDLSMLGALLTEGAAALTPSLAGVEKNEAAAALAVAETLPEYVDALCGQPAAGRGAVQGTYAARIWRRKGCGRRPSRGSSAGRESDDTEARAATAAEEALHLLFKALSQTQTPFSQKGSASFRDVNKTLAVAQSGTESRVRSSDEPGRAVGSRSACLEVEHQRWPLPGVGVFSLSKKILSPGFSSALFLAFAHIVSRVSKFGRPWRVAGTRTVQPGLREAYTGLHGLSHASSVSEGSYSVGTHSEDAQGWSASSGGFDSQEIPPPLRQEEKMSRCAGSVNLSFQMTEWLPQFFSIKGTLASSGLCATLHFSTVQQQVLREIQGDAPLSTLLSWPWSSPPASHIPLACDKQRAVYGRPPHLRRPLSSAIGSAFAAASDPVLEEEWCGDFADPRTLLERMTRLVKLFPHGADKRGKHAGVSHVNQESLFRSPYTGHVGTLQSGGLRDRDRLAQLNDAGRTATAAAMEESFSGASESGIGPQKHSQQLSMESDAQDFSAAPAAEVEASRAAAREASASGLSCFCLTAVVVTHVSVVHAPTKGPELVRPEACASPGEIAALLAWSKVATPLASSELWSAEDFPQKENLRVCTGGDLPNASCFGSAIQRTGADDRAEEISRIREASGKGDQNLSGGPEVGGPQALYSSFLVPSVTPDQAKEIQIAIAAVLDCLECWRQERDAEAATELFRELNRQVIQQSERIERKLHRRRHAEPKRSDSPGGFRAGRAAQRG